MLRRRPQFDTLGIAAATVIVAAVVAIGRQFFDAGAVLASLMFPACLIFALGSLRIQRRKLLGLISIVAPLTGIILGFAVQTLLWGAMLTFTWIPIATIALTTLTALLMLWGHRTRKSVVVLTSLFAVGAISWLVFQVQATKGERWVGTKFPSTGHILNGQSNGWVRFASTFNVPASGGHDLRRVEGSAWRSVHQLRLLFGLSSAVSLQVQQPIPRKEWELVAKLKHLKRLTLENLVVDDDILANVGEIELLERISFLDCRIEGSLAALANLNSLKQVSLADVAINQFQGLEQLESLEGLIIGHTPVTMSLANAVVNLPKLKGLHVYGERLADAQFDGPMLRVVIDKKKQERMAGNTEWLRGFSVSVGDADVPTLVEYVREFSAPGVLWHGLSPDQFQAVNAELDKADGFDQSDVERGLQTE